VTIALNKFAGKGPALLQAGQLFNHLDAVVGEAVNVDQVDTGLLRSLPKEGIDGDAQVLLLSKLICQSVVHLQGAQLGDIIHRTQLVSVEHGGDHQILQGILGFNMLAP